MELGFRVVGVVSVVVVVLQLSLLAGVCRADLDCNLISPKSPSLRLKRHLFCEYDNTIRPVTSKNASINVTVSLSPKFMNFVDRTSTFVLHTWIFLFWNDEHLTWKPEDFEGVDKMRVKSDEIWVPDFSVYNSGDMTLTQSGVRDTVCQLMHTGKVTCVPSIKYKTQCETDFTYWPYDKQTCSIRMGSWTHTGEEISFDFRRNSINMMNFHRNNEWQITNYTARKYSPKFPCCPNDTFPTLIVDFNMQRHSHMIHAVYITPAIVLMVITLTVLWLDSRSIERISLAAVNFVCHILTIDDLHWILPSNGSAGPPHILLFYRDSMVLATFAMIVTTLLRKLQATKVPAPGWTVGLVASIASNRAGRFLLLDNAGAEDQVGKGGGTQSATSERDVEENASMQSEVGGQGCSAKPMRLDDTWRKLAIVVEWLALFAAAFTYALLIVLLVPMTGTEYPGSIFGPST